MGFREYVLKRVLLLFPILFGVSVMSFALIYMLPGGPVEAAMGGVGGSVESIQARKKELGFNRPIYIQYIDWVTDVLRGDLGETIASGRDVSKIIWSSIGPTYWLATGGLVVSVMIGIPAGIISAVNQYSIKDYAMTSFAFLGLSIPNFWLGIMLALVFGLWLSILPTSGFTSPFQDPIEGIKLLILPSITLGTAGAAIVTRMMRSSMLEVLSEGYIRAAKSKGLPNKVVLYKHAVRNALIPTITVIGINFGYYLGGAVIVESIFSLPGMGRAILNAVFSREFSIIQAGILLIAVTFTLINLTVDLLYVYIDPRIKYD